MKGKIIMSFIPSNELFTVEKRPVLMINDAGQVVEIPKKKAIVVNDKAIAISSDNYELHQPSDIMEQFENVTESLDLEITKQLANPHNGSLLLEARYMETSFLNEKHDVRIALYVSHNLRKRTVLRLGGIRHACANQLPMIYAEKDQWMFSEKHYKQSLNLKKFTELLEGVPSAIREYNCIAEQLADKKMSYADFTDFYINLMKLKTDSKQFNTKMEALNDVYYKANGQDIIADNTAYKAFQAITFINTHDSRKSKFRDESIFFKSNDSLKAMRQLIAA